MLPKAPAEVAIEAVTGDYDIGRGMMHARVLNGPRVFDRARPVRTALFLHGGGLGSNFTQVERPARWLIARDLFDQVILPDRRGAGGSPAVEQPPTLDETADDLRRLLDRLNMDGALAAIGVDVGGPQALTLAWRDPRVRCVGLVASSPQRVELYGPAAWLLRVGVLRPLLKWEIGRAVGKAAPKPANFDPAYDARTPREMTRAFGEALHSIPAERAESLRVLAESELNAALVSAAPELRLDLPVLQVIGEVDEVWGAELAPGVRERFPNLKRKVISGAYIHKDVFFKAQAFYDALFELIKEECRE